MTASVSLVISVYNRENYLEAAIASVLAQTYPHFELLIWDDGSTDSSLDIAHHYAQQDDRLRVIAAPHQGIAPALKSAIAHTSAPYLGWVDSDDRLAPTALAETVAVLEAHPTVGLVYTSYTRIDEQGRSLGQGKRCQIPYSKERLLVDFMTFHFRLIRRSTYDHVGGIDATFERAEDYDLCLRLSEITEIRHLQRPLYSYRQHAGNATKDQLEMIRWTHKANTQALQRRGLGDRYQIDLNTSSKFILRPKLSSKPLVSIIIPCYNAQATIATCLQSCFQQTYIHLEIIVVDNNSTDQTLETVEASVKVAPCPLHRFHCSQQGANHARNHGLLHAKGDYIQWLDADDQLDSDKIALQVAALEGDRSYDIAYGDWLWCFYRLHQPTTEFAFVGRQYEDDLLQALMDNWRPPHCYLLRRPVADHLHQLQAWNPTTRACMDREYFTLAALSGYKFRYVPNSSVRYNSWSSTQITRTTPYLLRVQSLRAMFQRFQQYAHSQAGDRLQKTHWFLLSQNWDLWKPVFSIAQQSDQTFWLQRDRTEDKMLISQTEATILAALLKSRRALTLEDHARKVIQRLWREIILRIGQSSAPQQIFNHALVSRELAKAVGLPVPSATTQSHETATAANHPDSYAPDLDNDAIESSLDHLIRAFPLYTPLFAEQRLVVQGVLERLRQQGWLQRQTALPEGVDPKEFTNWALAPVALEWIARFIQAQGIRSVVELGSGLSTLLLATLQRDGIIERSLSLEHDPQWYGYTLERLQQKMLLDHAQVQLCPLEQVALNGELTTWYNFERIAPFPSDLILVDEPPNQTCRFARYPALHLLQSFIKKGSWIILDDHHRHPEQATVERWLNEFPNLQLVEVVAIDTGLAVLSFH